MLLIHRVGFDVLEQRLDGGSVRAVGVTWKTFEKEEIDGTDQQATEEPEACWFMPSCSTFSCCCTRGCRDAHPSGYGLRIDFDNTTQ